MNGQKIPSGTRSAIAVHRDQPSEKGRPGAGGEHSGRWDLPGFHRQRQCSLRQPGQPGKPANDLADLEEQKPVALADISYANGADNGFMQAMTDTEGLLGAHRLFGWNTADNSIGFAPEPGNPEEADQTGGTGTAAEDPAPGRLDLPSQCPLPDQSGHRPA